MLLHCQLNHFQIVKIVTDSNLGVMLGIVGRFGREDENGVMNPFSSKNSNSTTPNLKNFKCSKFLIQRMLSLKMNLLSAIFFQSQILQSNISKFQMLFCFQICQFLSMSSFRFKFGCWFCGRTG